MNNNGQTGIIGFFFVLVIFIIMWALFLASWLSQIGSGAIINNSLTGLEAFIWGNLNLWVLLGVLGAGAMGVFFVGGSQQ